MHQATYLAPERKEDVIFFERFIRRGRRFQNEYGIREDGLDAGKEIKKWQRVEIGTARLNG